jgi:hypothetical protein
MEERERRMVPRTTLAQRPEVRVRDLRDVRLLDLSLTGAQIEHLGLLRPGAGCTLDLLPPYAALNLAALAVWCAVIGRKRKLGGESHLVSRSGLRFARLTGAQHAALADTLQDLVAARHPIADRQQRSA